MILCFEVQLVWQVRRPGPEAGGDVARAVRAGEGGLPAEGEGGGGRQDEVLEGDN